MIMKRFVILLLLVPLLLIGIDAANAQGADEPAAPQAGYDLSWYTIDGGGATVSTGGSYSLGGTIGQPDAGTLDGGSYQLNGGFWGGGALIANHAVYLPLLMKNSP